MTDPKDPFGTNEPGAFENSERGALAWLHTARFLTTAALLPQLPPPGAPEIAFVGRSNAGKSTAINTLTQRSQLAFASRKPGRTQHINLFALGRQGATDALLVDLPGYGYAAVAQAEKQRWQQVMAQYLHERASLAAVVLLVDPRQGITALDDVLLNLIGPRLAQGLQLLVLLTKADKLSRSEQQKALAIARLQTAGGTAQMFSALKRQGVGEAALWLMNVAQSSSLTSEGHGGPAAPEGLESTSPE